MDRINGANWIDIGGGKHGFRNRNLSLGQAGTTVDAIWLNGIQEELLALLAAAGITPDAANYGQVLASLQLLFSPGRLLSAQLITVTTTLARPAGATKALVRMIGAVGGGGGSAGTAGSVGSPAGGAGIGLGLFDVSALSSIVATIGAAGTAGTGGGSPTAGTAGGTTSFGSLMSITGSGPGQAANGSIQGGTGAGGVVTGALVGRNGQSGSIASAIGSAFALGQPGGCWGGYPPLPNYTGGAASGQAGQLGVGGGGGALSGPGGVGFRGEQQVEWFA